MTRPNEPARIPLVKQSQPGEERRRSQRVVIRVGVKLQVTLHNQANTYPAETVMVNDHGALVVAQRGFPTGTRVELVDERTEEHIACRVTRPPREAPGGFQVALEFEKPRPGFWRIYFPPSDTPAPQ